MINPSHATALVAGAPRFSTSKKPRPLYDQFTAPMCATPLATQLSSPSSDIMTAERFLKRQDVEILVGLSKATIYRLIAAHQFPRPIALTARAVRWRQSEVVAWQQQQLEKALVA